MLMRVLAQALRSPKSRSNGDHPPQLLISRVVLPPVRAILVVLVRTDPLAPDISPLRRNTPLILLRLMITLSLLQLRPKPVEFHLEALDAVGAIGINFAKRLNAAVDGASVGDLM